MEKPEPAQKPKRKRSTALTLEAIGAVPVPESLSSLPDWSEAWTSYASSRQELKSAVRWKTPEQVTRMLKKLERDHGKGLDVVTALHTSAASGYQGVFPKPFQGGGPMATDEDEASADIPASPEAAWKRIKAALDQPFANNAPGPQNGWYLWPQKRDPRVHTAMMAALCRATEQEHGPYAWQMLVLARRKGPDSYGMNQIGRVFRKVYPASWQAVRGAA